MSNLKFILRKMDETRNYFIKVINIDLISEKY